MKILISVDGSEYTKRMLAHLAAHDWLMPTHRFTIFHGLPALPHRAAAFAGAEMVQSYYEDDAESVFRPIRQFISNHQISADFIYKVGHPAENVAAMAREGKYDMVVMGSHGHGAFGNLVLGSVATKVLAMCTTPVLLVR